MIAGELALESERRTLALGAWGYTTQFEDGRGTWGVYALAEQRLYARGRRSLTGFVRVGAAEPTGNLVRIYAGGGLVLSSTLFEGERIGVGVASAKLVDRERWETAFELTWRVPVVRGVDLQPDLQIVLSPGAAPSASPAVVLGARALVQF